MIKRDNWGHPYFVAIGEILGFTKDEQLPKHLPRVFSLMRTNVRGSKTIRYCPSSSHKRPRLGMSERYFITSLAPYGKPKFWDSRGSIVAEQVFAIYALGVLRRR